MEPSALPGNRPTAVRAPLSARRGFALLSPAFLDELRSRIVLSTLVGRTVPLRKAGNEFKACCPFHQEKTPSYWVNDQKGFYHCFGCGVHGDAIRWLTDERGMAFMDAVRQLADEVGLELPKPSAEEAARQEQAAGQLDLLEAAARHFHAALYQIEGSGAREYLSRRQVTDAMILEFALGYAADSRSNLKRALPQFTEDQLVEAGLLIRIEGKEAYDRFRNRLMVPIRDPRGRIIAFGGRILGDGEPKYLNSPDTSLFDKSRILFNLDRGAPASRQAGRLIVVEGYFDVIALAQAGIREAVAPMGTALTEAQLEQLWRLVDEPILCFDGDRAGRAAAERASVRAMSNLRPGKQLRVALLPSGQDPDDLVRNKGREAFENVVARATPLVSFLYETERNKINGNRPEQRANLRKSLEDLARSCTDRLVADEFARSLRDLFFEEFGWKRKQSKTVFGAAVRTSPRVAPDLYPLYVRSTLYGLTRFPQVAAAHMEELGWIQVAHPELERWRDAIGEAIILDPHLGGDGLQQHLDRTFQPETLKSDVTRDLRFGFTRRSTLESRALAQLETMVRFLAQERMLKDEMEEQDRRAVAALRDEVDAYSAIETSRQKLREARAKLFEGGATWEESVQ
ncbi:MAG: primase [Sphingomonadales bacterium]|nr:primase [Sphingomonadales bacterium]